MPKRRINRRFVLRAAIFLLIGAIVNVAVAWGCSWRATGWPSGVTPTTPLPTTQGTPGRYSKWTPPPLYPLWLQPAARFHNVQLVKRVEESTGSRIDQLAFLEGELYRYRKYENDVYPVLHSESAGWPMLSLQCSGSVDIDISNPNVNSFIVTKWRTGIAVPKSWTIRDAPYFGSLNYQRPIPFGPIWPGFAINTFFYAVMLWLLIAGLFAARSWRRLRRGVCPACAYPIGGNAVCTECGCDVPLRAVKMKTV